MASALPGNFLQEPARAPTGRWLKPITFPISPLGFVLFFENRRTSKDVTPSFSNHGAGQVGNEQVRSNRQENN